jgi:hypothetical protein
MSQAGQEQRKGQVLRPPARSKLLKVYRKAVPTNIRLALRRRISPSMQSFLATRLTAGGPFAAVSDALASTTAKAKYGRLLHQDGLALGHTEIGLAVVSVRTDLTPLRARRETLDDVMALLTEAGVAFFCVRGFDPLSSAVAVAESDRATVLQALRAHCRRTGGFLSEVYDQRINKIKPGWEDTGRLSRSPGVRLVQFYSDPHGSLVIGSSAGCDIEFWQPGEVPETLESARPNRAADVVDLREAPVTGGEHLFTQLVAAHTPDVRSYPTRPEMLGDLIDDITFPIDIVYTWVDGSDPTWRARRDQAHGDVTDELNEHSANESRYLSRDELRYSLRSLAMFAPWVRHIWLVTDDQIPAWLDPDDERITVVSHKELFAGRGKLPTFNSHAIETQLHKISGLTEHFLYFNDDVSLARPVIPQAFFHANGVSKVFLSRAKVDPAEVDVLADKPVTAAGKNNRELIDRAFGRRLTFKMKHVPHCLRRSVLEEMDERFGDEVARTAGNQFRHPTDVSMTSSLYPYYALLTGRAVIDNIVYMYTDLAAPTTPGLLRLLLAKRNYDIVCLNDTDSDPGAVAQQTKILNDFFSAYFPAVPSWERPDATSGVGPATPN